MRFHIKSSCFHYYACTTPTMLVLCLYHACAMHTMPTTVLCLLRLLYLYHACTIDGPRGLLLWLSKWFHASMWSWVKSLLNNPFVCIVSEYRSQLVDAISVIVWCYCQLWVFVKQDSTVRAYVTSIFSLFVSNEHIAMTENKKRKLESEGKVFNSEWTNKCLFAVVNSKILCLVWETWFQLQKNLIRKAILKPISWISLN